MYELALFAGAGGGILGGILRGHVTVGAVEIEEYPRNVLLQRQRDGILPKFPVWDDVTTFRIDNPECREYIEKLRTVREELTISGGFPCQDISCAGKGAGIKEGTRSGLWFEMSRIISEIRPANVLVENSPNLTIRGGTRVIADLASMGYCCQWGVIGASAAGATHKRERMWIFGNSSKIRSDWNWEKTIYRKPTQQAWEGYRNIEDIIERPPIHSPRFCRVDDGLANRVERVGAIGNGQVPAVVRLAWDILQ